LRAIPGPAFLRQLRNTNFFRIHVFLSVDPPFQVSRDTIVPGRKASTFFEKLLTVLIQAVQPGENTGRCLPRGEARRMVLGNHLPVNPGFVFFYWYADMDRGSGRRRLHDVLAREAPGEESRRCPSPMSAERSAREDEHSLGEDECSAREDEPSPREDEHSRKEDERSAREDERSEEEDECSPEEDERSPREDERSREEVGRSEEEDERPLGPGFTGNIAAECPSSSRLAAGEACPSSFFQDLALDPVQQ